MTPIPWNPNPDAIISIASSLIKGRRAKFSIPDKSVARAFLNDIGYKKPFFVPLGGTIVTLFINYPHYFAQHPTRVWISDMVVCDASPTLQRLLSNSWLGDGTNLACIIDDPTMILDRQLTIGDVALPLLKDVRPAFQVVVPDVRSHFGSLLQQE